MRRWRNTRRTMSWNQATSPTAGPLGGVGPDGITTAESTLGRGQKTDGGSDPHDRHVGQGLDQDRERAVGRSRGLGAHPLGQLALDRHHHQGRAELGMDQQVGDHRRRDVVGQVRHELEPPAGPDGQPGAHVVEHLGVERVLVRQGVALSTRTLGSPATASAVSFAIAGSTRRRPPPPPRSAMQRRQRPGPGPDLEHHVVRAHLGRLRRSTRGCSGRSGSSARSRCWGEMPGRANRLRRYDWVWRMAHHGAIA